MHLQFSPVSAVLLVASIILLSSFSADAQSLSLQPRMGDPVAGLSTDQLDRFLAGKIRFEQTFLPTDGLGPVFNQNSCASCHAFPVGGSGPIEVTRFGLEEKGEPFDPLADLGGSLLNANAIDDDCLETVPAIANVVINRLTPSILGAGLVEAIETADIVALENSGAGTIHWVGLLENPGAPLRPGRFGWKAQLATLMSFSADASLQEMGITSVIFPADNPPQGDPSLLALCDAVSDPEDQPDAQGFTFLERITDFQRFLAAPPQTPRSGMTGEVIFGQVGCASCHHSSYTTGTAPEIALSNQSIRPYSDFLLHDMGSLGDGIVQGAANETEMRTPSLWGIRSRSPLLHDGRVTAGDLSTRIAEAVSYHGGQGQASADAYAQLSAADQALVVAFLDSLGRGEFDDNGDAFIDSLDVPGFIGCYTTDNVISPDDPCAVHDIDQDGDVDDVDLGYFEAAFQGIGDCDSNGQFDAEEILMGSASDCNNNGIPDNCDIASGAPDLDGDGLPDECAAEFVRGDTNNDNSVDVADVINALGYLFGGASNLTCEDAADCNDDGALDVADPISLLNGLFSGGPPPNAPYPDCGIDLTPDPIPCLSSNCP